MFQHTAARRRLVPQSHADSSFARVSTHSRPKAAGAFSPSPENLPQFQHTAARRRLGRLFSFARELAPVSTHSRPKAAGTKNNLSLTDCNVSTHSRPKAAGLTD